MIVGVGVVVGGGGVFRKLEGWSWVKLGRGVDVNNGEVEVEE